MSEVGHNSSVDPFTAEKLREFVERIESVEREIADRNDDKKSIYGEIRSVGLDAKIVKKVVRIRAQDRDERHEEETILGLYLSALGVD